MSILIVYGTKYSFTEECANVLGNRLDEEVVLINLQKDNINDLSNYEKIIIGGPIYAGHLSKKVRQFCMDNLQILLSKKIGLYVSCSMTGDEAIKQMKNVFPEQLYNSAVAKDYLGGKINIDKAKFFDRLIIKMVSKADDNSSKRNDGICMDKVGKFVDMMNKC